MTQNYEKTKTLLSALNIVGWALVVLCLLGLVMELTQRRIDGILISSLAVGTVSGILIVLAAQVAHAQISTAETAARILDVLQQGSIETASPQTRAPEATRKNSAGTIERSPNRVKVYRGIEITRNREGHFEAAGQIFDDFLAAEAYIREIT